MSTATRIPTACPACRSTSLRPGPVSRRSGRRIIGCRTCGAHFLPEQAQPPADLGSFDTAEDFGSWVDIKREQAGPDAWRHTAAWLHEQLAGSESPVLYDVGAGDGQFLQIARDEYGFAVTGNDVVTGAVALAKERYGVDLELGDLAALDHDQDVDAVTLWCVLAHVPDGDALLRDVHRMLRPGGYLALQTPHWTGADGFAHAVQRLSGGRVNQVPDRRIAEHHMILHTRASVTAQLERHGFTDVVAEPQLRYTLTSRAYLASMNPPAWTLGPASWLMDKAIASPFAPKIVLDVRARRA